MEKEKPYDSLPDKQGKDLGRRRLTGNRRKHKKSTRGGWYLEKKKGTAQP